ncbi:MAG: hypothetical protein GY788_11920 [bacterium]|nr:hypothetical protein [bacterium]
MYDRSPQEIRKAVRVAGGADRLADHTVQNALYSRAVEQVIVRSRGANVVLCGWRQFMDSAKAGGALVLLPHLGPAYALPAIAAVKRVPLSAFYHDTSAQLGTLVPKLTSRAPADFPDAIELLPSSGLNSAIRGIAALRSGRVLVWQPDAFATLRLPGILPVDAEIFGVPCSVNVSGSFLAEQAGGEVFVHELGWKRRRGPRFGWKIQSTMRRVAIASFNREDAARQLLSETERSVGANILDWLFWKIGAERGSGLLETLFASPPSDG